MDPWLDLVISTNNNKECRHSDIAQRNFEDNFHNIVDVGEISNNTTAYQPLPDSNEYLLGLEHKLEKLKNGSKLIDALSEKRDDCLRSLLQNTEIIGEDFFIEFEDNLQKNSHSVLQNFCRYIKPTQPATLGETVEIIKYDQLQHQHIDREIEEKNHNTSD